MPYVIAGNAVKLRRIKDDYWFGFDQRKSDTERKKHGLYWENEADRGFAGLEFGENMTIQFWHYNGTEVVDGTFKYRRKVRDYDAMCGTIQRELYRSGLLNPGSQDSSLFSRELAEFSLNNNPPRSDSSTFLADHWVLPKTFRKGRNAPFEIHNIWGK